MHILLQLVDALNYLHDTKNIVHRDLKLENILVEEYIPGNDTVNDKVYIKLTDFGFASEGSKDLQGHLGTPHYMAPELISNSGHDSKVDIWAVGVIAYKLFSCESKFPFDLTKEEESDDDLD